MHFCGYLKFSLTLSESALLEESITGVSISDLAVPDSFRIKGHITPPLSHHQCTLHLGHAWSLFVLGPTLGQSQNTVLVSSLIYHVCVQAPYYGRDGHTLWLPIVGSASYGMIKS